MTEQLEAIKARFEQVGVALTNPEIINNKKEFERFSREYRQLEKIINPFEEYKKVTVEYDFAKKV
jgi:peptide chain release factor 1